MPLAMVILFSLFWPLNSYYGNKGEFNATKSSLRFKRSVSIRSIKIQDLDNRTLAFLYAKKYIHEI